MWVDGAGCRHEVCSCVDVAPAHGLLLQAGLGLSASTKDLGLHVGLKSSWSRDKRQGCSLSASTKDLGLHVPHWSHVGLVSRPEDEVVGVS